MKLSKRMAAGALAASLSAGGAAGALLFTPGVSGAQTDPPAATAERPKEMRGGPLSVAAGAIGIEVEALRDALREGQTIAQVAQANGVDPQTVVDALAAEATARLQERLATVGERAAEMVNRPFEGRPFRGPGRGPR